MPKSNFIPTADADFLVWFDHFIAEIAVDPEMAGVTAGELDELKTINTDNHATVIAASAAYASARQATLKNKSGHDYAKTKIREIARRIKAKADYTEDRGAHFGIIGSEKTFNLATAKPDLTCIDSTGGIVSISFTKHNSDGINLYCQRENDPELVLIGRALVSPFMDNRPLLQAGKPELRRYTAVYMLKNGEIGQFSDDVFVNCAP